MNETHSVSAAGPFPRREGPPGGQRPHEVGKRGGHFCLGDFDFQLPDELIAQHPAAERSGARLLDGREAVPADRMFRDFPSCLRAGDLLVFNDTQVVKARLFGQKPTGGRVELLVERVLEDGERGGHIAAHMRVSKRPALGSVIELDGEEGFTATLVGRWPDADGPLFRLRLQNTRGDDPYTLMERHGHVPLPPYITHADSADDARRYQTVFARHPGAVAAPTAALHFDEAVLARLDAMGVQRASVTLHVGAGTFQPVKTENLAEHRMHHERFVVPVATQEAIAACRARGGRVVAVGTTSVRSLESWALGYSGETDIFITPGFQFQVVDLLLTNFHLPKSSLMMLISAFAGFEHVRALYAHAIAQRYRFFSYGDAMLLQRSGARP